LKVNICTVIVVAVAVAGFNNYFWTPLAAKRYEFGVVRHEAAKG
jgi:hypothetical protein